jgi:hypothetical protein
MHHFILNASEVKKMLAKRASNIVEATLALFHAGVVGRRLVPVRVRR